jgi:hypothetical protein
MTAHPRSRLMIAGDGKRTLLWRWMVYSRETTWSMADLPAGFFPLDDISITAKSQLLIPLRGSSRKLSLTAGCGVVWSVSSQKFVLGLSWCSRQQISKSRELAVGSPRAEVNFRLTSQSMGEQEEPNSGSCSISLGATFHLW